MRVVRLTAYRALVRLKRAIKHASHARKENETLLVRAELETGEVGWGEGLPRTYVTGETIASCFETLQRTDWGRFPLSGESLEEVVQGLRAFPWPRPGDDQRSALGNSARCAVELAVLDAVCRGLGVPLGRVAHCVPECAALISEMARVRYGVAIMSVKPWKELASATAYRLYGFEQCKAKVGVPWQDEVASLRRIRRGLGPKIDLRIDANEGWAVAEVERRMNALRPFGVSALEQPVAHGEVTSLREIRPRLGVPVMLDESLCDMQDAERAIALGLCDLFNLRLSKCGGFINCLLLAARARSAGLGYQLGCMVGETGILSAAGRHFAGTIGGIRYLEGSFDRYLVHDRLTREDLTFGRGGVAPVLTGAGLGVAVDQQAVEAISDFSVELLRG